MVKQSKVPEKKSLQQVMKDSNAVFSITLSDGFANIEFDEKGDATVQFLNEEGYPNSEDAYQRLQDIEKVARFMQEMKELRLKDYEK